MNEATNKMTDSEARELGLEWCDADEHWVDPEVVAVHTQCDSNGDPDVSCCEACASVDQEEMYRQLDEELRSGKLCEYCMSESHKLADCPVLRSDQLDELDSDNYL